MEKEVKDQDWGGFVNLRGALMRLPAKDYPALYDALHKGDNIPDMAKTGFVSLMLHGLESCFALLRDMKHSGELTVTDALEEGMYRATAFYADGSIASVTVLKREELPLSVNDHKGNADVASGSGE